MAGGRTAIRFSYTVGTMPVEPGGAILVNRRDRNALQIHAVQVVQAPPGVRLETAADTEEVIINRISSPHGHASHDYRILGDGSRELNMYVKPMSVARLVLSADSQPLAAGETIECELDVSIPELAHHDLRVPVEVRPRPASPCLLLPDAHTLDVEAGPAESLHIVATPAGGDGRRVRIVLRLEDAYGNLADGKGRCFRLQHENVNGEAEPAIPAALEFADSPALVLDATVEGDGAWRVVAREQGGPLQASSNVVDPRFRVAGMPLFFGEIHAHSAVSDGLGDPDDLYAYGREAMNLDFCASGDHALAAACPQVTDRWGYMSPDFATLQGFEWCGPGMVQDGHKNIYLNADGESSVLEQQFIGDSAEALFAQLEDVDAVVIPHHTDLRSRYWSETNWSVRHDRLQPVVEICQNRGSFESAADRPQSQGASVQTALALGHKLGFIGGTDNHQGHPAHAPAHRKQSLGSDNVKCGLAVVFAESLTRAALMRALQERRCYATSGARILLNVTVNDERMGTIAARETMPGADARRIVRGVVTGTAEIVSIELVRNNEVIASTEPGTLSAGFGFTDSEALDRLWMTPSRDVNVLQGSSAPFVFYYVRIRQRDGHRAWSSPTFLLQS